MYLCVCRALSDRQVRQAVIEGAETVGAVFRACGTAPQCGSCMHRMRAYVAAHRPAGCGAVASQTERDWAIAAE